MNSIYSPEFHTDNTNPKSTRLLPDSVPNGFGERIEMRSLVTKQRLIWLSCLLLAIVSSVAWAAASGTVTKITHDPKGSIVSLQATGHLGRHLARVIGQPNRLVIDFEDTVVGKIPRKIPVKSGDLREMRTGHFKGQARLVLDFGDHPVPTFDIKRKGNNFWVKLAKSASSNNSKAQADRKPGSSQPARRVTLAAAKPYASEAKAGSGKPSDPRMNAGSRVSSGKRAAATSPNKSLTFPVAGRAAVNSAIKPGANPVKMAQAVSLTPPPRPRTERREPSGIPMASATRASRSVGPGMPAVRNVRPPVTPPTPDPRLLVQEITELTFTQVGHNSRLIVRGGDHLDYRLTKTSPTKLRVDLINAEIPKRHQKALKTDKFSTSVEMIVPGSQTLFVQLKDAVPYQVQKKKGVLMIDFPPPRFVLTEDQASVLDQPGRTVEQSAKEEYEARKEAIVARREASRIRKQTLLSQQAETIEKQIRDLLKRQDDINKERKEIDKKYPLVTPDPEVFNKPVTMKFQGISLKNAFKLLAEQAGINIIIGDGVTGTTTLTLNKVPMGQVIDHLLNTNDLERDIIGNVMWIGSKAKITANKEFRAKQRRILIDEVQKKLAAIKKEREDLEKKREEILKDIAKTEEEEAVGVTAPEETTRVETVGTTETIDIDGEPITLLLVQVRLNYRKPAEIIPILDCVFNRKCGKDAAAASGLTGQGSTEADRRSQELRAQGFQPGSPGYEARMATTQRRIQQERRTVAAERVASQVTGEQVTEALGGEAMDQRMQKILAHTIMWGDTKFNLLFIKDLPERIEDMKRLILTLDTPTPQVLIEARLVQADRTWSRGLGVLWGGRNAQMGKVRNASPLVDPGRGDLSYGLTGASGNTRTQTGGTATNSDIPSQFFVNLPATVANLGNLMGVDMTFGLLGTQFLTELDARLQFGEATGRTKIIARPKVQVMDGKSANITNGTQIAYSSVSADGTQTQLVSVNLSLNVTPKIYPDGRIEMTLNVTDNDVGPAVNGVASIITRTASTNMIVKDGETAVIGGIIRRTDNSSREGWPGLMNMPIINFFFTNKSVDKRVQELLVFITPSIVKRPPSAS